MNRSKMGQLELYDDTVRGEDGTLVYACPALGSMEDGTQDDSNLAVQGEYDKTNHGSKRHHGLDFLEPPRLGFGPLRLCELGSSTARTMAWASRTGSSDRNASSFDSTSASTLTCSHPVTSSLGKRVGVLTVSRLLRAF